jgi:hypothetical protein
LVFEEHLTAAFVADRLAEFGITVHRGLAGTGVVGTLSTGDGPTIGLRADMDGLPIPEANDFSHRSTHAGRMHPCGHDGHIAMLLGAARYLAETRRFRGTVHFIFQPAEENEGGVPTGGGERGWGAEDGGGGAVRNLSGRATATIRMRMSRSVLSVAKAERPSVGNDMADGG